MNPIPLSEYRHYKGNQYEFIGFAKHNETHEDMVVYKALYGERGTWVRPLSLWENPIEIDCKNVKRFEYIGDNAIQKDNMNYEKHHAPSTRPSANAKKRSRNSQRVHHSTR